MRTLRKADIEEDMISSRTSHNSCEDGFTLVELLITIVVMGILFAIALPIFTNVMQQGRVTRLKTDITSSVAQLNAYYDRYGKYPDAATFDSSVAVVTKNSNDQIVFKNPNNQPSGGGYDKDVCVLGTLFDNGKTFSFSYNLAKKKLVSGACTYNIGTLPLEEME